MRKGRGFFTVLLIIVVITALGLGGYLAYTYISTFINQKEAAEVVDEFENVIAVEIEDEPENVVVEEPQSNEVTSSRSSRSSGGSSVRYKGYTVIGTIEIPKTRIKYPIVSDTSPAAMDKAIVYLYGPGLNEVGNCVIVGHNYRNGGFFGNNQKLANGDKIYITDTSGRKIEYTVYNKYTTPDSDFSYASRNTNGKREISLSTCTSNASTRLIVWARES